MTPKIKAFIKRNRIRNISLYDENLIENQDYIVCPVTHERMTMMKTTYITGVLEMSIDEFESKYPSQPREATSRVSKIKKTMDTVLDNGMTIKESMALSVSKAMKSLDANGKTKAANAAVKSNITKSNVGADGLTVAERASRKAIISGNRTKVKMGLISAEIDEYKWYKNMIWHLIGSNDHNDNENVLRVKIKLGYDNNVSPFAMASLSNLTSDSNTHNSFSSFSVEELLESLNMSNKESSAEFAISMSMCLDFYNEHGAISYGEIITRINDAGVCTKR